MAFDYLWDELYMSQFKKKNTAVVTDLNSNGFEIILDKKLGFKTFEDWILNNKKFHIESLIYDKNKIRLFFELDN